MRNPIFRSISSVPLLLAVACCSAPDPQGNPTSSSSAFNPTTSTASSGSEPATSDAGPLELSHSLDYMTTPAARKISTGGKSYQGTRDGIFVDGLGREAYFRGFNISGNVKLSEHQFRPFKDEAEAEIGFSRLAGTTGSNMIRFLISWEGVHPSVDTIDYGYLDAFALQLKKAIAKRMYVLVDYHQDLFSRHLFNQGSQYTGNGAPAWVTPPGGYPAEYCGIICANWSQNNLTNEAIRRAYRNFWDDAAFPTSAGPRRMQGEFIWQMGAAARHLKEALTDEEFDYILGLDPFNEPVDGGMAGLSPAAWDNQKLWPFYRRVRQALDESGWQEKWVYAEPLVFWNTNVGAAIVPATGGGHLSSPPGPGFVFNAHFYDAARMGVDLTGIDNATYFKYLDEIRREGRFLQAPVFLSEFGMSVKGIGAKDTARMVSAVYQAMEISDGAQVEKSRYADLYSPIVSGTEWQWDYYYDRHHELMNGNPSRLITQKDAWNGEDFSVIGRSGTSFNMDYHVIQRAYPRRAQGDIMSFHYNTVGHDTWNNVFAWAAIRPSTAGARHFADRRFAILIWRGRRAGAPTEVFLPPHFDPREVALITEKNIYNKAIPGSTQDEPNEAVIVPDPDRNGGSGSLLLVWDDVDDGEDIDGSLHYLLAVDASGIALSEDYLASLQGAMSERILHENKSPIYLTGKMTYGGYRPE